MGRYQRVETFVHALDIFLGIHIIVSVIKCGDYLLILYNCGVFFVCVCVIIRLLCCLRIDALGSNKNRIRRPQFTA